METFPGLSRADLESTWSVPPATPPVPWWQGRDEGDGLVASGGAGLALDDGGGWVGVGFVRPRENCENVPVLVS